MGKVKNKKVILRIADKTRKAAKGKNIIAVLAIALTALLFTSVFTIGGSLLEKQQESTMRQVGGSSHGGYKYLTEKEYDIVKKDKKIKDLSYRIIVGDAVNNGLMKLRTEVSYYEDLNAKSSFCYPETGRMPQKENEIVTSDLVLKALDIPCKIGEKVTLALKIGLKTQKKTFVLSGYYKGDTISQAQIIAVSKIYANKVAPTPTKSAMDMQMTEADYPGRIMADFNFSNTFQLEKKMDQLSKRCDFPESVNDGVNWAYMGMDIDFSTTLMIGVLLLIILASGYLIIYNIFYINVFRDIQHYGLLKTIGTTGRQLAKMVRRQAFVLALYGIPLGLVCGVFIGKLLLPLVFSQLIFSGTTDAQVSLNWWIFAAAAAFSFITIYISCIKPCRIAAKVTPIEAVRFTEGQGIQRKETKKTKRVTPQRMAAQNIKRNKKKVIVVVTSLSLALILLNSIYGLISGFDMDKYIASKAVSDFSVADATLDNFSVSHESIVTDGVTQEFQKQLTEQKGIESIGNVYVTEKDPVFTDQEYTRFKKRTFEDPAVIKRLKTFTEGAGDDYLNMIQEERHIDGKVYGINELIMNKLEAVEGEVDWEKFKTGKYVIATGMKGEDDKRITNYFLPGEKVTVTNEKGEKRQYEVLALGDLPYACGLQYFSLFECNYILPEREYLEFMGQQQPMRTLFNVSPSYEKKTEKWLSNYCEKVNSQLDYTSKSSIVKEFQSNQDMYATVGGLLAFILAMIGILNFVNTMTTSVLSRKQEFAMMQAVGMTGSQLKQMLCFEGLYYALFTCIVSVVLGSIVDGTVVRSMGNQLFFFTWHFTITPVLVCIPLLLVIAVAVPAICCNFLQKISIVERIRQL